MSTAILLAAGAAIALGIVVVATLIIRARERKPDFLSRPEDWGRQ